VSGYESELLWVLMFFLGSEVISVYSLFRISKHPNLLYAKKNEQSSSKKFAFSYRSKVPEHSRV